MTDVIPIKGIRYPRLIITIHGNKRACFFKGGLKDSCVVGTRLIYFPWIGTDLAQRGLKGTLTELWTFFNTKDYFKIYCSQISWLRITLEKIITPTYLYSTKTRPRIFHIFHALHLFRVFRSWRITYFSYFHVRF